MPVNNNYLPLKTNLTKKLNYLKKKILGQNLEIGHLK